MSETSERQRNKRPGPELSGERARQGKIILRTRTRRILFIAGLVGLAIIAILLRQAGA